jgi:hypothetical protein
MTAPARWVAPEGSARPPRRGAGALRTPDWVVPVLFVLLLVGFGAGIWGTYRETFPGRGLHRITGVFEGRPGDTMILVRHESVPGVMPEMKSMVFVADSREVLDRAALQPGDRIRVTVRRISDDQFLVVDIRKIR